MSLSNFDCLNVGWRFDNSYSRLPNNMFSSLNPQPAKEPDLITLNESLSSDLNLNFSSLSKKQIANLFAGNLVPIGSDFIAQAYAGHQYGHFTMLGDGRALLMGEHLTKNNIRFDIQLKGSGRTPYSRSGDGRAALGPVLREYIISEAMHGLKIPSTRSLAVVTTGERVIREERLPGAVLTRVASSHIRVGTFQYLTMHGDVDALKKLVIYTAKRHFPSIANNPDCALALLREVVNKQINLIIDWMRVGFVHGVMNTDNMAVSGETIDYGPCAFMDRYNVNTVFSSIDLYGRYSFGNQPSIAHWNLCRFAETLLPLIHKKQDTAIEMASEVINSFGEIYKTRWLNMMKRKLGLFKSMKNDEDLIKSLLSLMQKKEMDYTNTFNHLGNRGFSKDVVFQDTQFVGWYQRWRSRILEESGALKQSIKLMQETNPLIIPRNHKVEEVLGAAVNDGDYAPMFGLLKFIKNPYKLSFGIEKYHAQLKECREDYKTFCGT